MDNTIDGSERQIFILEGGIGIFGFAVLNTFLIGFSVFVSKDFHICNKRLVEDILLDTILMHGYNTGSTRPSEK